MLEARNLMHAFSRSSSVRHHSGIDPVTKQEAGPGSSTWAFMPVVPVDVWRKQHMVENELDFAMA